MLESDHINHPPWYTQGKIEVLDFIIDQHLDWCSCQVIKYLCRAPYKGKELSDLGKELSDLKKARFYLERRIKDLENP